MNRLSEWFIENKLLNLKPSKTVDSIDSMLQIDD